MLKIVYEDSAVIVAVKPVGLESQVSRGFAPDMVSEIKKHLVKNAPSDGGNRVEPYVGVIHRLDKPVSGLMVYAKTKKAAASLSRQVKEKKTEKIYSAVVCGKPVEKSGEFVDWMWMDRKNNKSMVVEKGFPEAKEARLKYHLQKTIDTSDGELSLVKIELLTGRHHQIRVQFASRGMPLYGDCKYNDGAVKGTAEFPALCACGLGFFHPDTGKKMQFSMEPEGTVFHMF